MGLRVRLGLVHCTSNYDKQLTIVGQAQRTSFLSSELSHLVGALEMASEGPQHITEKYYGVYLPSYTIYLFAINLSICHTTCNLSTVLIHL